MKKTLLVLLVFFAFPASGHAADKIRFGFPDLAATFVPLAIADKRGFFQEEGLQGEFIRINPGVAIQALVTGEIDYYTVLGPAVAAAIRGVPVKLVAAYVPVAPTALIARPEIKSVPELKNKTIGVNAYGGALEGIARLILRHFNIDPDKEIKFLATGPLDSRCAQKITYPAPRFPSYTKVPKSVEEIMPYGRSIPAQTTGLRGDGFGVLKKGESAAKR